MFYKVARPAIWMGSAYSGGRILVRSPLENGIQGMNTIQFFFQFDQIFLTYYADHYFDVCDSSFL